MLVDEFSNFEKWAADQDVRLPRPNSMNNYGLVLQQTGFRELLSHLTREVVRPLATVKFPDVGGATIDHEHSFLVEYEMGHDQHLDVHVDDSEVTTNICLGSQFEGGSLFFEKVVCDRHQQRPIDESIAIEVHHTPGYAVFHVGSHRHGALPILSGHRVNLILWHRSTDYRREKDYRVCPEWCAFHPCAHVYE